MGCCSSSPDVGDGVLLADNRVVATNPLFSSPTSQQQVKVEEQRGTSTKRAGNTAEDDLNQVPCYEAAPVRCFETTLPLSTPLRILPPTHRPYRKPPPATAR